MVLAVAVAVMVVMVVAVAVAVSLAVAVAVAVVVAWQWRCGCNGGDGGDGGGGGSVAGGGGSAHGPVSKFIYSHCEDGTTHRRLFVTIDGSGVASDIHQFVHPSMHGMACGFGLVRTKT
jgi:hypothetical protein